MKKRRILLPLFFCAVVLTVNAQTDLFANIGKYFPVLEENLPELTAKIAYISEKTSDITDYIPTPSEIIAFIKNEELPIDPSDVAVNAYITNSPMLTFFPDENISIVIENNKLRLFGNISSDYRQHLVITLSDANGEQIEQLTAAVNNNNKFSKTITIPETDSNKLKIDVYAGTKAYGEFSSWVYNYLYITRTENGWETEKSLVYNSNKTLYEKDRSISDALKSTASIQSTNSIVKRLAEQITENCSTDYEKLTAIHDWICENIYYNADSVNAASTPPYSSVEVLDTRKAVCLGFSTLSAAFCRSVGIPCNVVGGYALGVGSDTEWTDETAATDYQNHAWNEAYVDGRWIIFDTTWDCKNKIENGKAVRYDDISHIYFDANLDTFSSNHKIIEYIKRI